MLIDAVIASFEYRARSLNAELESLETGRRRLGEQDENGSDWRDVTAEAADALRREICEVETIVSRLRADNGAG